MSTPMSPVGNSEGGPQLYRAMLQRHFDVTKQSIKLLAECAGRPEAVDAGSVEAAYNIRAYKQASALERYLRQQRPWVLCSAMALCTALRARLREQVSGFYDFKTLYQQAQGSTYPRVDAADYVSPNIALGINKATARAAMMPGTLVVVQKAWGYSDYANCDLARFDLQRQLNMGRVARSIEQIGLRAACRITAHEVTVQEVEAEMVPIYRYQLQLGQLHLAAANQLCGFGVFPAFNSFIHCCANNCSYSVLGDLLVVTTVTTVQPGEQLTVSWASPFSPLGAKDLFLRHRMIVCSCHLCSCLTHEQLCRFAAHTAVARSLIREIAAACDDGRYADQAHILSDLAAAIQRLEAKERSILRSSCAHDCLLLDLYLQLAKFLLHVGQPLLGKAYATRCLAALGWDYGVIIAGDFVQRSDSLFGLNEATVCAAATLARALEAIRDRGIGNDRDGCNVQVVHKFKQHCARLYYGWEGVADLKY